MTASTASRTIKGPAREIKVYHEADVLVVGGGPGGHLNIAEDSNSECYCFRG